jgi:transposase
MNYNHVDLDAIKAALIAYPTASNRAIGKSIGVTHNCVIKWRRKWEKDGTIPSQGGRTVAPPKPAINSKTATAPPAKTSKPTLNGSTEEVFATKLRAMSNADVAALLREVANRLAPATGVSPVKAEPIIDYSNGRDHSGEALQSQGAGTAGVSPTTTVGDKPASTAPEAPAVSALVALEAERERRRCLAEEANAAPIQTSDPEPVDAPVEDDGKVFDDGNGRHDWSAGDEPASGPDGDDDAGDQVDPDYGDVVADHAPDMIATGMTDAVIEPVFRKDDTADNPQNDVVIAEPTSGQTENVLDDTMMATKEDSDVTDEADDATVPGEDPNVAEEADEHDAHPVARPNKPRKRPMSLDDIRRAIDPDCPLPIGGTAPEKDGPPSRETRQVAAPAPAWPKAPYWRSGVLFWYSPASGIGMLRIFDVSAEPIQITRKILDDGFFPRGGDRVACLVKEPEAFQIVLVKVADHSRLKVGPPDES